MNTSELLHFSSHRLQEIALAVMAIVYTTRLLWFFRFKAGKDRFPHTGRPDTDARRGGYYSIANVVMPWAMESTRKHPGFYTQFVIFHLGVVANITLSFVIPYGPRLLSANPWLVLAFQIACGAACLVGVLRIARRATKLVMRAISTPDDYFSVTLLTVWFALGVLAAPNDAANSASVLIAYFLVTAFFLLYVPFSKISHYLYYPFTRYYLGKTMGHRGVYPLPKGN
jgi:nitrate reductase gamma subunit